MVSDQNEESGHGEGIRELLSRLEVLPSRKLGQNFLTDPNSARWIVDQLDLQSGDTVIEVGPGTGALTRQVLETGLCRKLILIEYDRRLALYLADAFKDRDDVEVIPGDGASIDIRPFFAEGPIKLLGNLPYSAAGEIMRNFLVQTSPVVRAVLMVQREVADRIVAKPACKSYGLLTLRLQARWKPVILKNLGPHLFHPRPQIDSTVMAFEKRAGESALPAFDDAIFDRLIRCGYSQRRKQLRKLLPDDLVPDWEEVVTELNCSPTVRAEELPLQDWIHLARHVDPHPLKDNPQRGDEMFDVVDDNDEIIGQETRDHVHANKLKHRAVHIFVLSKKGELLLQKRSMLKDTDPGGWGSSASGHLDVGESYRDCAIRELQEELGLEGTEPRHLAVLPPSDANGWEFVHLFEVQNGGTQFRFPFSEVETCRYFPVDLVREWLAARPEDFAGGFGECFQLAFPQR